MTNGVTGIDLQGPTDPRLYRCAICRAWKTAAEFHSSRRNEYTYCRECRNAYDRLYYAQRGKLPRDARRRAAMDAAREWMNTMKEGLACADCGETFPPFVMHWDHLPGYRKVDEISSMLGHRSRESILEELKKCELVCANCHVMRTVKRATGQRGGDLEPVGVARLERATFRPQTGRATNCATPRCSVDSRTRTG